VRQPTSTRGSAAANAATVASARFASGKP
jgi:hypothetical protein